MTVSTSLDACIPATYINDEGEECFYNLLEVNVSLSTMNGLMNILEVDSDNDEGGGECDAADLAQAVLLFDAKNDEWQDDRISLCLPYKSVKYCKMLIHKLGMVAAFQAAREEKVTWG